MSAEAKKAMLVHKGFFYRNMLPGLVSSITTHNITKDLDIEKLKAAVHRVVDRNPILSGTFFYGKGDSPGLFVDVSNPFTSFLHVLATPDNIPSPADHQDNAVGMTKYIQTYIEPHVPPPNKGTEEISKKLPLLLGSRVCNL